MWWGRDVKRLLETADLDQLDVGGGRVLIGRAPRRETDYREDADQTKRYKDEPQRLQRTPLSGLRPVTER